MFGVFVQVAVAGQRDAALAFAGRGMMGPPPAAFTHPPVAGAAGNPGGRFAQMQPQHQQPQLKQEQPEPAGVMTQQAAV